MFTFETVSMYRVAVGLNDQKAKIQLIETEKAFDIVSEYCANHFGGATVTMSKGIYKHEDGVTVVRENTIVIDLVYVAESEVETMVNEFKTIFNQESVMVIGFPKVDCCFAQQN